MLWVPAMNLGNQSGWNQIELRVSDFVKPTGTVKIRFSAEDNPNDSVVEACVDDLTIERLLLEDTSLWANGYTIPVSTGAVIDFTLHAGAGHAGRPYLLLGSLSGTYPGYMLPGGEYLPLNWDLFTELIMAFLNTPVCQDFLGTLDGTGAASATLNTYGSLSPAAVGLEAHFAYVLGNPFDFTSNPIPVTFEP